MAEHWNIQINIQINIQKVTRVAAAPTIRGLGASETAEKRDVISVLELKVTAESERAAYDKAQRMLTANHPDVVVVPAGTTVGRDSSGKYQPIRDNPQA